MNSIVTSVTVTLTVYLACASLAIYGLFNMPESVRKLIVGNKARYSPALIVFGFALILILYGIVFIIFYEYEKYTEPDTTIDRSYTYSVKMGLMYGLIYMVLLVSAIAIN